MLNNARSVDTPRATLTWSTGHFPRSLSRKSAIVLLFVLSFLSAGQSQSSSDSNGGQGNNGLSRSGFGEQRMGRLSNDSNYDPVAAEKRFQALNIERQKEMVADANKLLKLAKELNDEVAAANAGSFTATQLHKISEIEKLARGVRERMASGVSVAASPNFISPPGLVFPNH